MKVQDKILKNISLLKFKDIRIIQKIAYHPLFFTKEKMMNSDDERPIRIRYFGVFMQKYLCNKSMLKKLKYIYNKLRNDPKALEILQQFDSTLTTSEVAQKKVNSIFKSNNKDEIEEIYNILFKAIGD